MTFYKNVHCDTQSGPPYFEPIPQVDEIYSPHVTSIDCSWKHAQLQW
jgi:hypothetical protein